MKELIVFSSNLNFLSESLSRLSDLFVEDDFEEDLIQIHITSSNYRNNLSSFIDTLKFWKLSLDSMAILSGENVSNESLLVVEPGSIVLTIGCVTVFFSSLLVVINKTSSAAKKVGEARKTFAEFDKIRAETDKIKAESIKTEAEAKKTEAETEKIKAEAKKIEHEIEKENAEKIKNKNLIDKAINSMESELIDVLVSKIVEESLQESEKLNLINKNDLRPKLTKSVEFLVHYFIDGNELKLISNPQNSKGFESVIFSREIEGNIDQIKFLMSALENNESRTEIDKLNKEN